MKLSAPFPTRLSGPLLAVAVVITGLTPAVTPLSFPSKAVTMLLPLAEEQLTDDTTFHAVTPIWRGDCQFVAFLGTQNPLPNFDPIGDVYRTLVSPSPSLVEERVWNDPEDSLRNLRYTLTDILWPLADGLDRHWLLSWEKSVEGADFKAAYVRHDHPTIPPNIVPTRLTEPAPIQLCVNFPDISVPGLDPASPDRVWVVHEEDGFQGSGHFDDTVRSQVDQTTRLSVLVAPAGGNPFINHEKPRWSPWIPPGTELGYSFRYVIFTPQTLGFPPGQFIACRYGFSDQSFPTHAVIAESTAYSTTQPAFSPDGKFIAFRLVPSGAPGQIWVAPFPDTPEAPGALPIAPSLRKKVSLDDTKEHARPSWDSGSTRVVYERRDGNFWQIYFRDPFKSPVEPGGGQVKVSQNSTTQYRNPSFSPCPPSCSVVFQKLTGSRFQIWQRVMTDPCPMHF